MNAINTSLLFIFALSISTVANAAGSMLRVTCEGGDIGAEVLINGKFRGECPVDLQVPEGSLKLLVRKEVDAQRERVFVQDIRMGEGAVKKVEARLGAAKLNAAEKARREGTQLRLSKISFDVLQKEAASGSLEAMVELARRYAGGRDGASKDAEMSATWRRKAAEAGDADSMYMMGLLYSIGSGVPKSHEQTLQWYRKAAAAGHVPSMISIGNAYDTGRGVAQDNVAAAQWFHKAAEAGDISAMEKLGAAYMLGNGVPKNDEQAVAWFRKAIEVVHDENDGSISINRHSCMTWLGNAYEKGRGVPQDEQQAVYWWRKAAEGMYPDAMAIEKLEKRGLR